MERPNLSNRHTTKVSPELSSAKVLSRPGRALFAPDFLSENINSFYNRLQEERQFEDQVLAHWLILWRNR